MKKYKHQRITPLAAATLAAMVLASTAVSSHAATVWNVNIGNLNGSGESYEITTGDNYVGAATENTANSTWNVVQTTSSVSLLDSTGASTGVTLDLSDNANFGNTDNASDEIFKSWVKDDDNSDP